METQDNNRETSIVRSLYQLRSEPSRLTTRYRNLPTVAESCSTFSWKYGLNLLHMMIGRGPPCNFFSPHISFTATSGDWLPSMSVLYTPNALVKCPTRPPIRFRASSFAGSGSPAAGSLRWNCDAEKLDQNFDTSSAGLLSCYSKSVLCFLPLASTLQLAFQHW